MHDVFKMPDPVASDPDHNPTFTINVEHFDGFPSSHPSALQHLRPGYSLVKVAQHETCIFCVLCIGITDADASVEIRAEVSVAVFVPEVTPVRVFVKRGFLTEFPQTAILVIEALDDEGEKVLIASELEEYDPWGTHEVMGRA
jgi:hypothetical protein